MKDEEQLFFSNTFDSPYIYNGIPFNKVYYTIDSDNMGFRAYSEFNTNHILILKKQAVASV
jgi:hypothetical protein